jgi:hypothetical protein
MKKILLTLMVVVMAFGCKSNSAVETKTDYKTARKINGNFILTTVTNPGSDYIKVNSLQLADSKCFEGSSWKFVSNNNKGNMSLAPATNCPSFSSDITWYLNKNGQFVLKVLSAGEKAKKLREGYVFDLANVTDTSFDLIDMVDVAGKKSNVTYHFQKN